MPVGGEGEALGNRPDVEKGIVGGPRHQQPKRLADRAGSVRREAPLPVTGL